jgi:nucleoside-diphosphate-sugar epimerase
LDDSKLRAKLGQVQKTTYDKGIQRTLDWIVAQAPSLPR